MTIEITQAMIETGINATGEHIDGRPLWKHTIDKQVFHIYQAMERARIGHIEESDIKRPNESGETQCIVRYMVETPSGWVGSWDKNAIMDLAGIYHVRD